MTPLSTYFSKGEKADPGSLDPVDPDGFSWILWILVDPVDPGGFWWILVDPGGSWWILVGSGGFWWILVDPGGFWWILGSCRS
jgi:hypothetical protein